jgi:hypothetical protein
MIPPRKALLHVTWAAVAIACLLLPAGALAAEHESQQAFEKQLAAHEIEKARINKRVRHLDLTLKNGHQFTYVYPAHHEPEVDAKVSAAHISVEILSPTAAQSEVKKAPVHHKLRYIAAGILGAIVIIVLIVLVVDRRRKRFAE